MQTILNQSLNTGAAHVAFKIGNERFVNYIRKFGLDTETGIDLPSEAKGLLGELDNLRDIEVATVSYGQGIATTPIAMVRALCALGNGGKLVFPHIVKRIEYADGTYKKIVPDTNKQVISAKASQEISNMLTTVVDESLRNGKMRIPGFSIAAKTGTAQMAEEGKKGYASGKYLHSFFGYFPANDPEYLILLYQTNPKNADYASETLTESFFNITKFLIAYYQVPPNRLGEVNKETPLRDAPVSTSTDAVMASSSSAT